MYFTVGNGYYPAQSKELTIEGFRVSSALSYIGRSSHRRKSAAFPKFDVVWLNISPIPELCTYKYFTYQCCGSGMFIPDPGSWFLPIPDLGSQIQKQQQKRRGEKNLLSYRYLFFLPQISQNWKLFYFWNVEEKKLGQFSKNCRTFYPKICHQALENMGLGSEIRIRKKPIPDPGSRGQKGTGSGSATLSATLA